MLNDKPYENAVLGHMKQRVVQRWNCPDCSELLLWQSPMTKAERIYHHYRVGHNEGGSLSAASNEVQALLIEALRQARSLLQNDDDLARVIAEPRVLGLIDVALKAAGVEK